MAIRPTKAKTALLPEERFQKKKYYSVKFIRTDELPPSGD
jgi:hypothetical protein